MVISNNCWLVTLLRILLKSFCFIIFLPSLSMLLCHFLGLFFSFFFTNIFLCLLSFTSLNCTETLPFAGKALVWFILVAYRWTFFSPSTPLEADFYFQSTKFNSWRRLTKICIISVFLEVPSYPTGLLKQSYRQVLETQVEA